MYYGVIGDLLGPCNMEGKKELFGLSPLSRSDLEKPSLTLLDFTYHNYTRLGQHDNINMISSAFISSVPRPVGHLPVYRLWSCQFNLYKVYSP